MADPIDIGTFLWSADPNIGSFFEVDNRGSDPFTGVAIQLFTGQDSSSPTVTTLLDSFGSPQSGGTLFLPDATSPAADPGNSSQFSFFYDLSAGQGQFDSAQLTFSYAPGNSTISGSDSAIVPLELDSLFAPCNPTSGACTLNSREIFFTPPATSPVPEPSTLLLLASGFVASAIRARRARARAA
jgi:hypothetical protein